MARRVRASGAQPFSVRLTADEKAFLEAKAGRRPLGEFVREQLLGDDHAPRKSVLPAPRERDRAFAQLLAMLGASELGANLARMVRLAETGILPVDDATTTGLRQACEAVQEIRRLLLCALGRRVPAQAPQPAPRTESLSEIFANSTRHTGDLP